MTRQAENTSRVHRQQHAASTAQPASGASNTPASASTSASTLQRSSCVAWRIDWYFHAAEPPIHVVSPQLLGTAVVLDAVRQLWSPAPVRSLELFARFDSCYIVFSLMFVVVFNRSELTSINTLFCANAWMRLN